MRSPKATIPRVDAAGCSAGWRQCADTLCPGLLIFSTSLGPPLPSYPCCECNRPNPLARQGSAAYQPPMRPCRLIELARSSHLRPSKRQHNEPPYLAAPILKDGVGLFMTLTIQVEILISCFCKAQLYEQVGNSLEQALINCSSQGEAGWHMGECCRHTPDPALALIGTYLWESCTCSSHLCCIVPLPRVAGALQCTFNRSPYHGL
jgi:hypothetical protein